MDTPFGHAEYFDQTTLHPLGLTALLVLGSILLLIHRRWAMLPIIVMACFIAPGQRIAIFGLNFDLIRMLVLIGFFRVIVRSELVALRWKPMDTMVVAWAVTSTLLYTALYQTPEALIYQLGAKIFDGAFAYFVLRALIQDWDDIRRTMVVFVVVSIPVAVAFLFERATARNVFSIFGGVPEITVMRNDRLRCQGAFAHPILAGVFWSAVQPLLVGLWFAGAKYKPLAIVGLTCSTIIILNCASSTPLSGMILGVVAWAFWPLRARMQQVRWGLAGLLLVLHFAMKNPVWFLFAKVDFVGGSTGWHRFFLMDEFIKQIGAWWAVGMKELLHEDLFDITNQYVLEGINGGLLSMMLFIWIIVRAFGGVGRLWRAERRSRANQIMAWGMGVTLFVHVTSFFAVSYFGQINILFSMHLAMIASLAPGLAPAPALVPAAGPRRAAPVAPRVAVQPPEAGRPA